MVIITKQIFNVAIVGCRTFNDYSVLKEYVDFVLSLYDLRDHTINIISGGAKGTDSLAEKYANSNNLSKQIFNAKWDDFSEPCMIRVNEYGKKYNALAGINRNSDIINACDICIAFWDNKSTGTKDSITKAEKQKKDVYVYYI